MGINRSFELEEKFEVNNSRGDSQRQPLNESSLPVLLSVWNKGTTSGSAALSLPAFWESRRQKQHRGLAHASTQPWVTSSGSMGFLSG